MIETASESMDLIKSMIPACRIRLTNNIILVVVWEGKMLHVTTRHGYSTISFSLRATGYVAVSNRPPSPPTSHNHDDGWFHSDFGAHIHQSCALRIA